jgi:hypothetical protein
MTQSAYPLLRFSALIAITALACSSSHQLGEKRDESTAKGSATSRAGATSNVATSTSGAGATDSTGSTGSTNLDTTAGSVGNSPTSVPTPDAGGTSSITSETQFAVGGAGGNRQGGAGTQNAGGTTSITSETLPGVGGVGGTVQGGAAGGIGGTSFGLGGGAGTGDETCTLPPVKIEITVDDPTAYCFSEDFGLGNLFDMEILTEQGALVTYLRGSTSSVDRNLRPECPSCGPRGTYGIESIQSDMTGETGTWNGEYEEVHDCDSRNWCGIRRCAPAGRYVAKFCAAPKGNLTTCVAYKRSEFLPKTKCIEVPFDFPTSEIVTGRITSSPCPPTQPAVGDPCVGSYKCLYDISTEILHEGPFNCGQTELMCSQGKYFNTGLHCDPF